MPKTAAQEYPAYTFKLRECDFSVEAERRNSDSDALNEILAIGLQHGLVWRIVSKETEEDMIIVASFVISHVGFEDLDNLITEKYQAYRKSRGLE